MTPRRRPLPASGCLRARAKLALTLAAAPGNSDAANARTQLLGGAAVTIAPYLLGNLADHVGVRAAFSIEAALVAIAAALLVTAVAVGRRTTEQEL